MHTSDSEAAKEYLAVAKAVANSRPMPSSAADAVIAAGKIIGHAIVSAALIAREGQKEERP